MVNTKPIFSQSFSPAVLIITEQPFSRAIVKGQMVTVEAQLLMASRVEIRFTYISLPLIAIVQWVMLLLALFSKHKL